MASFGDVFAEINALKSQGVLREYAIGGATAVLFYAEPVRTYDVDVFVLLATPPEHRLVSLDGVYAAARERGFGIEAEHILIHGVPVQFLPAHNELAEDAVVNARVLEYEGVPVRVIAPEHLVALAFQAGDRRRQQRAWQMIEARTVDVKKLRTLLTTHDIRQDVPDGDAT